jgi:tryptophan synthase beta chain
MLETEQRPLPQNRVLLPEDEIPTRYYNIQADLRDPLPPPLDPKTREPVNPAALERLFAKELIRQEISSERYIDIPDEVLQAYLEIGRPTPLVRATRLERFLRTPAKIFYKAEYLSPTGSHKPNTAIAQAYYNGKQGIERLATESGAGQWGSALALGASMFGLKCNVYMVRIR